MVYLIRQVAAGRHNGRLTPWQVRRMQARKFRRLVRYAARHSPYYQALIREQGIEIETCTPADFPVLTKDDVLEHFDDIVTDRRITKEKVAAFLERSHDPSELFLGEYTVIHTSGSSGTVGYYLYSQRELACGIAGFARIHRPSLGQKLAYVAAANGHFAGVTMAAAARHMPLVYRQVALFDINRPFTEIIDGLNRQQPTSLGGYAFALRKLAEAQQAGTLRIRPGIIQSGGEPLHKVDKDFVERVFGVPVVNVYAASEHLIMGIGRDDYGGMYLMEDDLIFEPAAGHTCITNLYNYTLPLIRYRMSDRLRVIDDDRHVLPFTKVANIVGRNEQVPVFLNDKGEEDFISPILLAEFYVKGINAFQFKLNGKRRFVFRVCLEEGLSAAERQVVLDKARRTLRGLLHEKLMDGVDFTIEVVDRLWADPRTGKFRLIIT